MFCLLVPEPDVRADMAPLASWLTPSEAARLQSLGTETRRSCFLAGRWLARRAVQRWLGADALPALAVAQSGSCEVLGMPGVHVSISHSAGTVACVASGVPVGIDVESLMCRGRDTLALAETVHGAAQREALAALPADARLLPFLQAWTLKEAWLKARGQGLDFALMRSLEFDDDPAGDVAVARLGDLVLAVAAEPALPPGIDGLPEAVWQRRRSRRNACST